MVHFVKLIYLSEWAMSLSSCWQEWAHQNILAVPLLPGPKSSDWNGAEEKLAELAESSMRHWMGGIWEAPPGWPQRNTAPILVKHAPRKE